MIGVAESNDLFEHGLEFRREEFVRFVHDDGAAFGEVGYFLGGKI